MRFWGNITNSNNRRSIEQTNVTFSNSSKRVIAAGLVFIYHDCIVLFQKRGLHMSTGKDTSQVMPAPANRGVIDGWAKLRDMTEQFNHVKEVHHRYMQMYRLALTQHNMLTSAGAKQDTIDGLAWILNFTRAKAEPLVAVIERLEKQIETETERLNNGD